MPHDTPLAVLLNPPQVKPEDLWPAPLPLFRDPEPPEPFPLDALGPLAPVVRETLRIVQAPDALVASSFLAAAALAAQGVANLEVDGRTHPLSLYLLSIAESGERKSTTDEIATRPIREAQRGLYGAQQEALAEWEKRFALWEAEKRRIVGDKRRSRADREAALRDLGPPPQQPWSGVMLASEPTYEGLLRLLAEGWPSGGLFSNEGGAFLGGYALSKDHRLRTLAGLSELWDGRPVDRVRSGDGLRLLYGRRLSLHLMAQPVVARTLLNDPLAQGQGLLARMLTAAPESTAGARRYVEDDIFATPAYQAYAARLGGLLERVAQGALANGRVLEGLSLRPVRLDPPAKGLWVSFYDHIEANLRGELSQIRAFASKLPEHALRLAGTLAVLKNPDLGVLTREDVKQGIAIAQFYGAEALRLAGGYRIPRELAVAAEVWAWLTRHCQAQGRRVFHLAEVYRLGPPAVRSAKAAREVLRVLEGHYYLAHRPNVEIDGASRRDAWEVNPHALSQV